MKIAASSLSITLALLAACSSSSNTPGNGAADASTTADASASGDGSSDGSTSDATSADAAPDAADIIAARPYTLHVPTGYDPSKPAPLVVMFHGYSVTGAAEEAYFRFSGTSDANGFLYAYGDGSVDSDGNRFWNATDGCCDKNHVGVDDVAYFDAIVGDVAAHYNVDKKRVFVIGHSNGGFMAHRLACDRAGTVAAIVSLAGAVYVDPTKCNPTAKVSVLEIHADSDQVILYNGGSTSTGPYPSAHATVATWAQKNGCSGALASAGPNIDIDPSVTGAETTVETYGGCPAGVDVSLDTMVGGSHEPSLNHAVFNSTVWGFLAAHPKP